MTTDADLLTRYLHDRDDTAFAALVRKHGPMVYGACRRVTADHHDAEDAFQACFVVLAARAETVRPRERLGAWLHGVAVRCARKARDTRRRTSSTHPLDEPAVLSPAVEPDLPDLIDDALAAIPDTYRAAVVLCHLEGRSRSEAARELGWSEGTLSGRLHRAIELLGRRLTARGVTATGAVLVTVLSARTASANVPVALSASTCTAAMLTAAGFVEPGGSAASLAHGVMRAMSFRKVKLAAAVLVGVMGVGSFAAINQAQAKPTDEAKVLRRNAPVPAEKLREWKELFAVKHESAVSAVAVCEDMLVTGYAAGDRGCNIHAWNPKDGEMLDIRIRGPFSHVAPDALRFVADGKRLMMTVPGGGIARYERQDAGLLVGHWCSADVVVHGFSDDLQVVAAAPMKVRDTRLHIYGHPWNTPVWLQDTTDPIRCSETEALVRAALSLDGKRLVVAHADSALRIHGFEGKKLSEERKVELPAKPTVTALRLSDDGKRLAIIGEKGFARVFDAEAGKELCELKGHDGTVNAAAFTPDGSQVATANGKTVRVFDAKSGKLLGEITGHTDDVTALVFTEDGKRLVTGSKDKTAKVWER